jgi:hypothetical protein
MGRNAEADVDDIVVKTRESHTFIEDLEETFANLRKVNIKLNPAKCAFGVPSGKLLGFLVSHREIEANPDKVKAIKEMRPPRNLKEMQCLAGCMAALGRFIARSGEKALPFFKLMKRTGKFEWTPEADKAFAELKRYLTSPPIMVAPTFREPLLLYIVGTLRTASAVLIAEWDAKVIAKEGIDPPYPGAPHEVEAAIPHIPQEEPPAATSPTEPTVLNSKRRRLLRIPPRCKSPCTSLARCYATRALGIKRLIVKGDSQLVVNFSNKSYTPKDEHMAAYLEERQKMEKRFQGLELKHIPRAENVEADEIAKHASHRLA